MNSGRGEMDQQAASRKRAFPLNPTSEAGTTIIRNWKRHSFHGLAKDELTGLDDVWLIRVQSADFCEGVEECCKPPPHQVDVERHLPIP